MQTGTYNGRNLTLFTNAELIEPGTWPSVQPASHLPHYLLTLWWAENFLTKPNKELGRAGPVCPFAGPSLERRLFWLTSIPGTHDDSQELEQVVLGYRDWFKELKTATPDDSVYKTILMLLPDVTPDKFGSIIDAAQKKLKPVLLKDHLMFGQFHNLCEESGVQNPAFRPLKSPVPMLVIRYMTSGDIVFMKDPDGEYNPDFLSTYLKTFGKGLPSILIRDIQGLLTKNKTTANS